MVTLPPVHTGEHVAARFRSDAAFLAAAVAFAYAGVAERAQVMLFPAPRLRDPLAERLAASARLRAAAGDGHLRVMDARQVHLAGGGFDGARSHAAYHAATQAALSAGFPGLWVAVDMTWAHAGTVDTDALIAFEAAANTLFTPGTLTALCAYDTRVFTAGQIFRACQAHPATAEAARFAHRATAGGGLAFSGEADRSNALAWSALLASLTPDDRVIDISAMSFLSVQALTDLGAAAHARPLTIRATFRQVTQLSMLELDRIATIEIRPAPAA